MFKTLLLLLLFIGILSADAQKKPVAPKEENINFLNCGRIETQATFPGGDKGWANYLNKTIAIDSEAPSGIYKVMIKFVVDRTGNITDVQAETNNGHGIEEEVIRAIKKSPRWVPAMQNGRLVNSYRRQPVTFEIEQEDPVRIEIAAPAKDCITNMPIS